MLPVGSSGELGSAKSVRDGENSPSCHHVRRGTCSCERFSSNAHGARRGAMREFFLALRLPKRPRSGDSPRRSLRWTMQMSCPALGFFRVMRRERLVFQRYWRSSFSKRLLTRSWLRSARLGQAIISRAGVAHIKPSSLQVSAARDRQGWWRQLGTGSDDGSRKARLFRARRGCQSRPCSGSAATYPDSPFLSKRRNRGPTRTGAFLLATESVLEAATPEGGLPEGVGCLGEL